MSCSCSLFFRLNILDGSEIDYTDHGNPVLHPKVPHEHTWDWSDPDNPKRSPYDD